MSNAWSALVYLRVTTLQNSVLSRLRRLRQPKYLVGAVVGIAYLYFMVLRRVSSGFHGPSTSGGSLPYSASMVMTLVATMLLVLAVLCWAWPRARAAMTFSEAEIAFLFPSPLSQRALTHYQLISSQLRVIITALVFSLISSRWSFLPGHAATHVAGWWLLFATLSLHVTGSSFTITRWLDRGLTAPRRLLLVVVIIAVVGGAVALWAGQGIVDTFGSVESLQKLSERGPLHLLLLPFRLLLGPLFASTSGAFLLALAPALVIHALHYVWAVHVSMVSPESSIARAAKRAEVMAAVREGKFRVASGRTKARSAPFHLAQMGRPEWAFLWKNLLSSAPYLTLKNALIAAVVIVAGCSWLAGHPDQDILRHTVGGTSIALLGMLVFMGPLMARQDLRTDLLNTDMLKVYPVRGWQVVLGELLTPLFILTVMSWLLLLATSLTFIPPRLVVTPSLRWVATLGLAGVMPGLFAVQLLVMNAATVLFPAWVRPSAQREQGIDVMGQRIFVTAGMLLVLVVALLPASIVAALLFALARWLAGMHVAIALAALVVMAVLAAEVMLGVVWLGRRFEHFDLSAELRP